MRARSHAAGEESAKTECHSLRTGTGSQACATGVGAWEVCMVGHGGLARAELDAWVVEVLAQRARAKTAHATFKVYM